MTLNFLIINLKNMV